MDSRRYNDILDRIPGKHALVIGDVMLDEYVWGKVRRISPEAPVIVVEVERDSHTPGGATNVVNNVQALGGTSSIIGVIGDDDAGRKLTQALSDAGVNVGGLVIDEDRPTTRKTRIIAHSQQVVRVDRESRRGVRRARVRQVLSLINDFMPAADIVVFSDYDKGMASTEIARAVLDCARRHGKQVVVNPKPRNVRRFKTASVISMNQGEAEAVSRITVSSEQDIRRIGKYLVASLKPEHLLITRGPHGMLLFDRDGRLDELPAHLVEVYDVAGAGDTVVSVLALALAAGAHIRDAAELANCAGAAVVKKVGVATVSRDEIRYMLDGDRSAVR